MKSHILLQYKLKKKTIYISYLKIILLLKTFLNLLVQILGTETDLFLRLYLMFFSLGKNWKNGHSGSFDSFFVECLVRLLQQIPDIYILGHYNSFIFNTSLHSFFFVCFYSEYDIQDPPSSLKLIFVTCVLLLVMYTCQQVRRNIHHEQRHFNKTNGEESCLTLKLPRSAC